MLCQKTRRGNSRYGSRSPTPRAGVRRVRPEFPTAAIELRNRQRLEIHALEAANVHHVVCRVCPRSKERCDAAVPAKMMSRRHRTKLIGREIIRAGEKSKTVSCYHVMQIGFLRTNRAIALART